MSIVKRFPFIARFQGTPTAYVVHLSRGSVVHQGVGQAFWFKPTTSALSEVPVVDVELPVIFHASTLDHQDVTVQITATYRFADPVLATQRLEFGTYPKTTVTAPSGQEQAAAILTRLAQALVVADVGTRRLDQVIGDPAHIHAVLADGIAADRRLRDTGLEVVDLHVLAIRPEADVEKALQTPLREQVQAEADKATFERRALAVERERAISENELASKIELATRTQQLVAQEGANARRRAEEEAAAALIAAQGEATRRGLDVEAEAAAVRATGEANAAAIRATGEANAAAAAALIGGYQGVDTGLLRALALRDLAQNIGRLNVSQLTITPDLVSKALAHLGV